MNELKSVKNNMQMRVHRRSKCDFQTNFLYFSNFLRLKESDRTDQ